MAESKAKKRDKLNNVMKGLQANYPKGKNILLKGELTAVESLLTIFQASIDAGIDTDAKHTAYLAASKKSKKADAVMEPALVNLTEFLTSSLSATQLGTYGIKTKERAEPDVATKAAANAQREATRRAKGQLTKAEKKALAQAAKLAQAQANAAAIVQAQTQAAAATNGAGGANGTATK